MTSPVDLAKLEALERAAFRAPWTYAEWEIECATCASEGDCDNPECDGAHVPCATIESPEEYPDGQVVAQFSVPGLQTLADRNGAFIVALRNAFPGLVAAVRERDRLREVTGALDRQLRRAATERDEARAEVAEAIQLLRDGGAGDPHKLGDSDASVLLYLVSEVLAKWQGASDEAEAAEAELARLRKEIGRDS